MAILLSIAVPTFNRASILDTALGLLFEQVKPFNQLIEIIVSDNHSTDNTLCIIEKWVEFYSEFSIVVNKHPENTGFYGNFRKCKELATGKYIWLLSDDDHLLPDSLKHILEILNSNEPDVLYLANKLTSKKSKIKEITFENLVHKMNYKLTLITSSIFRTDLSDDEYIYDNFKKSSFIGFILLLSIFPKAQKAIIYSNKVFNERLGKPGGYNFYKVFVIEMSQILYYMKLLGYSSTTLKRVKNNILLKLILKRYVYQKITGKLDGSLKTFSVYKINGIIHRYYHNSFYYWVLFVPLKLIPNFASKQTQG